MRRCRVPRGYTQRPEPPFLRVAATGGKGERDGCGDKKVNAIVARMEERITDTSLIVENRNTCDDNSPTVPLTEKQIAELRACASK